MMARRLKHRKVLPWIAARESVATYNSQANSITKFAPDEINEKNAQNLRRNIRQHRFEMESRLKLTEPKFSVGQFVRMRLKKDKAFRKISDPIFSEELFEITAIVPSWPLPSYSVRLRDGRSLADSVCEADLKLA